MNTDGRFPRSPVIAIALAFACGVGLGWWLAESRDRAHDTPATPPIRSISDADSAQVVTHLARRQSFDELARRIDRFEHFHTLIDTWAPDSKQAAIDAWVTLRGSSFDTRYRMALAKAESGQYGGAIEELLAAALASQTVDQQRAVEDALAGVTDECARSMIRDGRLQALDNVYERITLALPELAQYHMKLGLLRIRTGDFAGALSVLAQIQNHAELGAQARTLMTQAEASETVEPSRTQELPLRLAGSQFIVDATIDDRETVALLIDTGAAMTVLDSRVAGRLGYDLQGRREYFATAGGVVEAPLVTLGRLSLGDNGIDRIAVGALPLDMPQGIDGLLGMNFLRHFAFRIDQESASLHLEAAP